MTPPDKQPPGGWRLVVAETGGTARGDDFNAFVRAVNAMLRGNGFAPITSAQILERMKANAQT